MRILVCIKQVLEPELAVQPTPDGGYASTAPPRWRMNRYDEHAVEQALLIKEAVPGSRAEAVSVGPERAAEVLTRAMGMGLDAAGLVLCESGEPTDPSLTAALLAGYARERGFDLVLTGAMSEDLMQAATGPMLAVFLGLPWASGAVLLEPRDGGLYLEREMEGGKRQMMQLPLPALVTVNTSGRQPRYPTLSKLLKAKSAKPPVTLASELNQPAPALALEGHALPPASRKGEVLTGDTSQKAAQLAARLRERGLL